VGTCEGTEHAAELERSVKPPVHESFVDDGSPTNERTLVRQREMFVFQCVWMELGEARGVQYPSARADQVGGYHTSDDTSK